MRKTSGILILVAATVIVAVDAGLKNFTVRFAEFFSKADHASLVREEMVHFPLRLKGTLDDSPEIKIGIGQFPGILKKIAAQPSGMNTQNFNETEKDFLSAQVTKGALPTDAGEGTMRLGNLVFGKKKKKWKLVMVYVSDELIAETHKEKKGK
jgi:hypothetical protein